MPRFRALFVPCEPGVLSHAVPLVALCRMLPPGDAEHAFLVPRARHDMVRRFDVNVLDLDHRDITTQMVAHSRFRPNVLIYDCSLTAPYAARLAKIPSVSIMRTGSLPGEVLRSSCRTHSMALDVSALPDPSALGLPKPRTLAELFQGDLNVIPAVPSLEPLEAPYASDPNWTYAGPLLINDLFASAKPPYTLGRELREVETFFERNAGRRIVYVTLGGASPKPGERELIACIRTLLENGYGCVTNLAVDPLPHDGRCLVAAYLPMHYVCARVDVIVHHCGSGAYQYPLLHRKPAVTIGTECVDREEVALRLAERGLSRHLPAPWKTPSFAEQFQAAIDWCLSTSHTGALGAAFDAVTAEIATVKAGFKLTAVLDAALAKKPMKAR
ncbi:MAG TPA: hypothetical protein VHM31_21855 [Polyangia bacterium]|nr:hypothetical protein [Polyangia bacterium]